MGPSDARRKRTRRAAPKVDTPTVDTPTVDNAEVARFEAMADAWWDSGGEFRALHKLNPVRIAYVRDRVAAHFGRDIRGLEPLGGLRLLDVGCGGGLLAEPMARLGARVVGVDAASASVRAARLHADEAGLAIDYRHATAEQLAARAERFDVVLNMEVVEHVADQGALMAACGELLDPGGATVVATLNRTLKAFALGIVGAEYLLGWLPRGSHRWERFVRPSELARLLRAAGLTLEDISGVSYNPLTDSWQLSPDTAVNYMAFAVKA